MGHLSLPRGECRGNYLVHRQRRQEEGRRESGKRQCEINVGEMKGRKKKREEKREAQELELDGDQKKRERERRQERGKRKMRLVSF